MFDLQRFVQDCTVALDETLPERAVREAETHTADQP